MNPISIEDELEVLDYKRIEFRINPFEELEVYLPDGTFHSPVVTLRSFPVTDVNRYISIIKDDRKREEVCLIEDIQHLTESSRWVLENALSKAYYKPFIIRLLSIERRSGGISVWKVETNKGEITIDLRRRDSVTDYDNGHLLIADIDGNRYEIPNYYKMDEKSIKLIMSHV